MSNKNPKNQINIEVPAEVADGIYSNLAIINHSVSEFVVDFVTIMPGVPKAKVRSRIILTPQHAKKFLRALQENVRRFEATHGTIKEYNESPQGPPINFGGPQGEA
jgi:hypothetical protein